MQNFTPCASKLFLSLLRVTSCYLSMDFQIKVHLVNSSGAQRVEKPFVGRDLLNPAKRNRLLPILATNSKIMLITQLVIEYLDDEEDYCILRDDERAFLEMIN